MSGQKVDSTADTRNPLTYLFAKTWEYSAGNRGKIVAYWSMFIVGNATKMLAIPLLMAKLIALVAAGIDSTALPLLIGLLVLRPGINLFFWCLHGPARVIECSNAFKVRANYRTHLLRGVMSLPMGWHSDHHSGDTIDKVEKGSVALHNFAEDSFLIIDAFVRLIVSLSVLAYFSLMAAAIASVMLAFGIWISLRYDRVLIQQYKELAQSENHVSESVYDAISNITTVIILRVEKLVFEAIQRKIEKPYALFRRNAVQNEFKWGILSMSCSVMTALVLGAYLWQHIGTPPEAIVGSIYLLINYVEEVGEVFYRFTSKYSDVVKQRARVMNAEILADDFKPGSFTNHVLPKGWRSIGIDNLCFSYREDGNSDPDLSDISMSLARGERIAFVGHSGSGKTTLLRIMRGLYAPSSLKLTADGRDIPEGFDGICRDIALVPQSPELFATTVLENITLGADYDMDTVRRYTDMACVTDVIDGLPSGFASSINEKGVNLSGGQQQRLALARGLLACDGKSVVLLDEPTSSVDPANEIRIHQNVFREFKDKTIISCVHRLYLLHLFDKIVMIDEGRIIGSGSLEHMLRACPSFRKLWDKCNEGNADIKENDNRYTTAPATTS